MKVGQRVSGYVVKSVRAISERNIVAIQLEHEVTKAKHFHVQAQDANNVFAVAFKTVPSDSSGVAHILEHTALCGSDKYPVRDPFFNMLKRSTSNYMNAWTGSDFTMYPFSTTNQADYNNLLSVYCDAAFFPRLEAMDFLQEGHRLEMDAGKLTRSGVVYNEMQGAMADPESLFDEQVSSVLFPTTTYHHNSGGNPVSIPSLTHEQLVEFHRTHYTPSNSYFYTYGDFPLENHLKFINDNVLSKLAALDVSGLDVPNEVRFDSPKIITTRAPPLAGANPDRQTRSALVWLAKTTIANNEESFALSLLSQLLFSGPNSPMDAALLASKLGMAYSPLTGYGGHTREPTIGAGVAAATVDDAKRVPEVVLETLRQAANAGFPQERIDSLMHKLKISTLHINAHFGLGVGQAIIQPWMHGGDPASILEFNRLCQWFSDQAKSPGFFRQLIEKHMLDNSHRVDIIQTPDRFTRYYISPPLTKDNSAYSEQQEKAKRQELMETYKTLTPAQIQEINEKSAQLKVRQDEKEDISCLPSVAIDDIPREKPRTTITRLPKYRFVEQPTNGLGYLTLVLDASHIPDRLLSSVPLFCQMLSECGAGPYDHKQLAQQIENRTGGISVASAISVDPQDLGRSELVIRVSSSALSEKLGSMLDLVQTVLSEPTFADKKLIQKLLDHNSSMLDGITQSGHMYARGSAQSGFGGIHDLQERLTGLDQVSYVMSLINSGEKGVEALSSDLIELADLLLQSGSSRTQFVAEESHQQLVDAFVDGKRGTPGGTGMFLRPLAISENSSVPSVFYPIPAQVYFCAKALNTGVGYDHPSYSALGVAAQIASRCYLHQEIREKGGAYGGGLSMSPAGVASFFSYRDPHFHQTLETFDAGLQYILDGSFDDTDVTEAQIGLFGTLDAPVSPSMKGSSEFLSGITDEMKQRRRDHLFAVDKRAVIEAASKYLAGAPTSIAVLGSEQTDAKLLDNWITKKI